MKIQSTTYLSALVASFSVALGVPGDAARANPTNPTVVDGRASVTDVGGGRINVVQSSSRAVIDWDSFSIAAGEHVDFQQPRATSTVLNRVTGGTISNIFGRITADGNVFLVNPNGVVFGDGAQIDVGGLVASTIDIDNADFMRGQYLFNGTPAADSAITNHAGATSGGITVRDAGLVAFVAPGVENTGFIQANLGRVTLAAGEAFTLDLYGDELVSLTAPVALIHQVMTSNGVPVSNSGAILADGGKVVLSASVASSVVDQVINHSGIIQATTALQHDGKIVLAGGAQGTVYASGVLNATGGTIDLGGQRVVVEELQAPADVLSILAGENIVFTSRSVGALPRQAALFTNGWLDAVAGLNIDIDAAISADQGATFTPGATGVINLRDDVFTNGADIEFDGDVVLEPVTPREVEDVGPFLYDDGFNPPVQYDRLNHVHRVTLGTGAGAGDVLFNGTVRVRAPHSGAFLPHVPGALLLQPDYVSPVSVCPAGPASCSGVATVEATRVTLASGAILDGTISQGSFVFNDAGVSVEWRDVHDDSTLASSTLSLASQAFSSTASNPDTDIRSVGVSTPGALVATYVGLTVDAGTGALIFDKGLAHQDFNLADHFPSYRLTTPESGLQPGSGFPIDFTNFPRSTPTLGLESGPGTSHTTGHVEGVYFAPEFQFGRSFSLRGSGGACTDGACLMAMPDLLLDVNASQLVVNTNEAFVSQLLGNVAPANITGVVNETGLFTGAVNNNDSFAISNSAAPSLGAGAGPGSGPGFGSVPARQFSIPTRPASGAGSVGTDILSGGTLDADDSDHADGDDGTVASSGACTSGGQGASREADLGMDSPLRGAAADVFGDDKQVFCVAGGGGN